MNEQQCSQYFYYGSATLVCFLTLLIATGNEVAQLVGYASVALLLIMISVFPILKVLNDLRVKCDGPLILLFVYLLFVSIGAISAGISGLAFSFDVMVYFSLYLFMINLPDQRVFRQLIAVLLKLFILACLFSYPVSPDAAKFSFLFSNSNVLGLFVLISSFFLFGETDRFTRKEVVWFLAAGVVIYLSMSRAALGSYLLIIVCLLSSKWLIGRNLRVLYLALMWVFLGVCYLYITIRGTEVGDALQELTYSYFEKNLYSGRQEIWVSVLESLRGFEYLVGKGGGTPLFNIIGRDLSAHNSFIQILFQSGIIGVLLIVGMLCVCIARDNRAVPPKQRIVKFAWVLGISFCALWEVFIFQNHPALAIFMTLVLATKVRTGGVTVRAAHCGKTQRGADIGEDTRGRVSRGCYQ